MVNGLVNKEGKADLRTWIIGILLSTTFMGIGGFIDNTITEATIQKDLREHVSTPGHSVMIERNIQQNARIDIQLKVIKEDLDQIKKKLDSL